MIKSFVKKWLKMVFWKFVKRPFILHPDTQITGYLGDYVMLANKASLEKERYLPVRYNYHTPQAWNLRYDICGDSSGTLRYQLKTPDTEAFVDVSMEVKLPCTWTISLEHRKLLANGEEIQALTNQPIPLDTVWLIGVFEFRCESNQALRRKVAHRIRLEANEADYNYFNGLVYGSYDEQAVTFPETILDFVSKHHPLQGKFLDVGCATGLMVECALSKGLDAEGIDYSAWAIEQADLRTNGRCRQLSFEEASAKDFESTYDIITMHSVLEHLADPERALRLLFEICRPSGVVYLETLNADSLMHAILGKGWGGYTDYTHKSHWLTADWLAETSKRIGFEVVTLKRSMVWNDNIYDDVWNFFTQALQLYPASVLLEEQFGDIVEVILRRPVDKPVSTDAAISLEESR